LIDVYNMTFVLLDYFSSFSLAKKASERSNTYLAHNNIEDLGSVE